MRIRRWMNWWNRHLRAPVLENHSYTESCRCSINVLNYSKSEYKEKYICVFGK
ncbi:hypothetical protein CLOSCI_00130 [[Clostridium] scindens ATCC 35704]|nr:hypothetical protein CLOSCI_00130 [[Clostridium] scindens ATCC 35704]